MAFRAEVVLQTVFGLRKILVVGRNRQPARLVVGYNHHERSGVGIGIVHRLANGGVEVAHLGQKAFGIVVVSRHVDERPLDKQHPAAVQ